MYVLSQRSLNRLKGVNHRLIAILEDGIKDSPHDFAIPREGGRRSEEDQHVLFLKGASKCDGVNKKSYHQSGNAFDIYICPPGGGASWDIEMLTEVARHLQDIAKVRHSVDLKWGGDWKSWKDYPHFEIRD